MKKQLRAAIYARYSTKHQNEASIEDQVRSARKLCEREGFKVVGTFSDAAISGGTAKRPGYQSLLAAARRKEFDVVVAESSSRLWRELAEQWRALKEWADLDIFVVGHNIDTRRSESSILLSVTGAANEAFRQEIGRRTRQAQEGLAQQGKPTGGRAYGYRIEKGHKVIDPAQAKVIRRIFQMRADGHSALAIVRALNADDIPAPGAAWARTNGKKPEWRASALIGDPRFGTGILSNPLYRGRAIWGRMKWKRQASDSSIRKPVPVPEREWIVHNVPHLRIVSDELFDAVQTIQSAETPLKKAIRKGIRMSPRRGKGSYWLSGILVCDLCGSNFQASGSESYSCPSNSAGKCKNDLRFKRVDIEDAMLEILRDELFHPDRLRAEIQRIEALLKAQETEERKAVRQSLDGSGARRVEAQIASVRKLHLGPAVERAAVRELETELESLKTRASRSQSPGLREARAMLAQLPKLAAAFDKQLVATLAGGKATKDEMRLISDATRDVIKGGVLRLRPKGKTVTGRVTLLGLGEKALRVTGITRRPRIGGSGGTLRELPTGHRTTLIGQSSGASFPLKFTATRNVEPLPAIFP